jgi:hypothetical protein
VAGLNVNCPGRIFKRAGLAMPSAMMVPDYGNSVGGLIFHKILVIVPPMVVEREVFHE